MKGHPPAYVDHDGVQNVSEWHHPHTYIQDAMSHVVSVVEEVQQQATLC